ncbi:MAG TPA: class I SAM-dependent methyltransferase [Bacteroidales bacterium]|nr:class I SAM-dependent methyltransferase [Bacteroidales bacterium]HSA43200.1 class I SAM-dependent methyltransferase [Bacteroidales bacterium]
MLLLSPPPWTDYELIDSGIFEKLERFGKYILIRPEPQAIWDKNLSEKEWEALSHAKFSKDRNHPEKGQWHLKPLMPEQWHINYPLGNRQLTFRLGLTAFKHVGIFPEQSVNWDYIYFTVNRLKEEQAIRPRVLNLFAYTGGASLAACAAGADVVHVDSVKAVITWARHNMEASKLDGIRWIVEDAMKFVLREVRRGTIYDGIILDPPAYGRGPAGEKWLLEDHILQLSDACRKLLDPSHGYFVYNLYSMGFSSLVLENLVDSIFKTSNSCESGELYIPDRGGRKLPLGIFSRFSMK